jgi:hypothetical protein
MRKGLAESSNDSSFQESLVWVSSVPSICLSAADDHNLDVCVIEQRLLVASFGRYCRFKENEGPKLGACFTKDGE